MKPSAAPAFFGFGRTALLAGVALLMAACDTTPRERQDIVKDSARKLDTLADKAGDALKRAGNRAARFDSVSKSRSRQPLDDAAANQFTQELLGSYASIEQLSVQELEPAYTQLLRQTRDKRRDWTQRDWDYATAVFRQLNDRYRSLRLDLPARQEFRIKTLQTEFTALEAGRDIKDLREAVRDKPVNAR
ncbi:hypothetical protein [Solirubrum puertoriconensis]|uniref:Lipoprotein n=1 Tax=Solirubrum puertoriconensis TaxID=1751427 RepID=A0A9X0HPQ8_SOLP1|nr:hypothetical protein [Solirubrum puertoriconensis]KUG09982.1 hypothetical protein ASU33_20780 [Solirubrum puertoriconensis]